MASKSEMYSHIRFVNMQISGYAAIWELPGADGFRLA